MAIFMGVALITNQLQAQEKKVVETKGMAIDVSRGADPNIIEPKPVNDNVVKEKPAKEDAARTDYCKVIIDNWTGYTVDVYVDGYYEGSCAAWEEGYTYTVSGKTKLYAVSVGGTVSWGPAYVDCVYEYTWQLTY